MMKVRVYHYDMTNRDLVADLSFNPNPVDIGEAWTAGFYSLAFSGEFVTNMTLRDADVLEIIYSETQETPYARSTSVGDIIVLEDETTRVYYVDSLGFGPLGRMN